LLTSNPILTAATFLTAALLVVLLWRPGAPPILLFVTGMLWLQPATKVLHADARDLPVGEMALHPATIDDAILLSLLAILGIAAGMRLLMGRPAADVMERLAADARNLSIGWLAVLTILIWMSASLAEALMPAVLRQPVMAIGNLQWVFLFALACAVFIQRRGYLVLGTIVLAQLVVGFTGFFSGFKEVLFLLFIVALTVRPEVPLERLPRLLAGVAVVIGLGLVWTAIKTDLRDFLNAGTGQQVVLRTPTERLQGLTDQLGTLESEELADASEALAKRLAYVDFFAIVLDRVPAVLPHEDGAILSDAIRHILTPRLLFPDKAGTGSDSEMTNKYTGLNLASARQGTSVNLGWPAEAYIDFGRELMVLPMLAIGILCGLAYRGLAWSGRGYGLVLSYGFAVAALIGLPSAGTLLKLLGALLTNVVVLGTIKAVAQPALSRLLRRPG
ncbi:MAG: hypothetical protein R3349_07345, partial [Geminicoccaceae bacterium]|nr:hypothetical protein [Geminicoccaceae bacterium]